MTRTSRLWLLLPASILISALIISGTIWWTARDFGGGYAPIVASAESQPPSMPPPNAASVSASDSPVIGEPNAPAIMAYWFDYQCPFCRQMEETVMPKLVVNYVNTGKLRIVFKDYEFLGADSKTAGAIARAVWETAPSAFYEWHKAVFLHQDRENGGWGSKDDILALTKTVAGVDETKVEQALAANQSAYEARMQSDLQEGTNLGVSGTPTAIIGDQTLSGAGQYEDVAAVVDHILASK